MKAVIYPGASSPAFVEDAALGEVRFDDGNGQPSPSYDQIPADDEHTITLAEYWRLRCLDPLTSSKAPTPGADSWERDPYDDFTIDAEIRVERMTSTSSFTVADVASLLCIGTKAAWARISRGTLPRPAISSRGSFQKEESRFSSAQVVAILARHARKAAAK